MKIKIIDLLNKIADNEEGPAKIMYDRCLYTCDRLTRTYYDETYNALWESYNFRILNNKVEIIEDSKKIEKIKQLNNVAGCKELIELKDKQQINNHILKDKINELIDEINNLKRE